MSIETQGVVEKHSDVATPAAVEYETVNSLICGLLLAFTGGSLDAFLYLNHSHVYAGVMTGNAVLLGISVFNGTEESAKYAWALFAYVVGIVLISILRRYVRHHPVRLALGLVMIGFFVMSLLPDTFNEHAYVVLVVMLTGFLVGISQKINSTGYNATVITGSLRDGTIGLFKALDPKTRAGNLRQGRDLWMMIIFFFSGAAAGGLLGRHMGNHALWIPIAVLAVVWTLVVLAGSTKTGFDNGETGASA